MNKIPIPVHRGYELASADDILYIQADGNFCLVIYQENQFVQSTHSLKELENQLRTLGFCRIHHKYLVNLEHIYRYLKGDGGEVVLRNGSKLPVSRGKKGNLIRELKGQSIN